jgi:hypothetical protein
MRLHKLPHTSDFSRMIKVSDFYERPVDLGDCLTSSLGLATSEPCLLRFDCSVLSPYHDGAISGKVPEDQ